MKEREKHARRPFVTNQEAAERTKPRDRAFDNPPVAIPPQTPSVFVRAEHTVSPIRRDQVDATVGEILTQGVAVVGAVADQVFGIPTMGQDARLQCRVDQGHFRGRRRGNGDSHRKTLTLDQYHAL